MKKYFLQSLTAALATCALSAATVQTVHAQGPARLDYNVLVGNQTGSAGNFQIWSAPAGVDGPYMHLFSNDNADANGRGSINYIAGYNANAGGVAHSFQTRSGTNGNWIRNMVILQNGQVQIGDRLPTSQTDYKLSVQGKLVAQSVYVTNPNSWADFVFEPDYKPMALPALESYLLKNRHLPHIPSATEVMRNGYSAAEMDAKLLQTVEELTLQLIELGKQQKEAVTQIENLKMQVAALHHQPKAGIKKARR